KKIKKTIDMDREVRDTQIAEMLVNARIKIKILDVVIDKEDTNKISRKSYETITDKKRPHLFDLDFAPNLTYGNFDDDLQGEDDSDIYIEAVKEELDIKHNVWKLVKKVAKDNALFATNTSGIPIEYIAKVFSDEERQRFFGMH